MDNVVLCNLSDAPQVIKEEKHLWIRNVLMGLGLSEEMLDNSSKDVDKYRHLMGEEGIEIETNSNGDVNIYKMQWHEGTTESTSDWLPPVKEHLVGQWKEPTYIKKIDGKDVYYELHLNEWSILNMRRT